MTVINSGEKAGNGHITIHSVSLLFAWKKNLKLLEVTSYEGGRKSRENEIELARPWN